MSNQSFSVLKLTYVNSWTLSTSDHIAFIFILLNFQSYMLMFFLTVALS